MTVHKRITVDGLACEGCVEQLEAAVGSVDGVQQVDVTRRCDAVEFVADDGVTDADVHAAIFDAGYDVIG